MSKSSKEKTRKRNNRETHIHNRNIHHYPPQHWPYPVNGGVYYLGAPPPPPPPYYFAPPHGDNSVWQSRNSIHPSKILTRGGLPLLTSGHGALPAMGYQNGARSLRPPEIGVLPTAPPSSLPHYYVSQNGELSELPSAKDVPSSNESQDSGISVVSSENGVLSTKEKTHEGMYNGVTDKTKEWEERKSEKEEMGVEEGKLPMLKKISNGIIFGLEELFYKLGMFVSCHPKSTIAVAIVIPCLLGIGLIKYHQSKEFADLLVPPDSRIHTDSAWVEENIPYKTRIAQFIIADDNVLTKDTLLAMYDLYNASLNLRVGDFGIHDVCNNILGRCFITSILDLWKYDKAVIETLRDEEIQEEINTVELNPTYYTQFVTSLVIGEVKNDDAGRIVAAGATRMTWTFLMNSSNEETVKQFENKIVELGKKGHAELDDVFVLTFDSFTEEYFNAVDGDLILILYSFPVVFIYMVLSMGKFNLVEHGFYLVIAAIVGVLLAAAASYGLCLAVGLTFGLTHQGLVFLLLGIGVDDAFVVMETWKRVDKQHPDKTVEEKVALTMKHAGVSVTVTSVSDFVAFAAGISSLMPVLSSFCAYGSIGILALFIIHSTFFPACLTLNQKRVQAARDGCAPCCVRRNYKPNRFSNIEILAPFFKNFWCPVFLSVPGKVIIILMSVGLAGVMSWSVSNLQKGFDVQRALPENSFARHFVDATDRYFPGQGTPFAVYCDTKDYYVHHKTLEQMEQKYKNTSAVISSTVTSWIQPFKVWLQYLKTFGDPVILDEDGFPVGREVFNQYLYNFVHTSGFGDAYKSYIDVQNSSGAVDWTIYRMQFLLDKDPQVNDQRLRDVRRIADTTRTDGTCFAYGDMFVMTETIEYVDTELIRNFLLAGVCVFVVVLLLVVDLRSSIFVLACVVFTTICLAGTLQFFGFLVDGNIVVLATFCIGLSVDFSAHVAFMFMTVKGTRNERAKKALENIGPAIFHGAISTFTVALVLARAQSYTLYLFFCTLTAIMLYGLFAGLCLLPVVLSLIGPDPYPDAENITSRSFRYKWYTNELMASSESWAIPRPQLKTMTEDKESEKKSISKDNESEITSEIAGITYIAFGDKPNIIHENIDHYIFAYENTDVKE